MALTKKPVTGMKDILPAEMQVRDYVIGLIQDTYNGEGFTLDLNGLQLAVMFHPPDEDHVPWFKEDIIVVRIVFNIV